MMRRQKIDSTNESLEKDSTLKTIHSISLTVAAEGNGLVALPGGSPWGPVLVVPLTLATQATVLLARRGESTELTVLVHGIAEPVDPWIVADSIVGDIHKDHLKVFVGWVLIHPVGVEHPKTTQPAPSSFLSNGPLVPLELELGDTLVLGLAIDNTLGHWSLPATTPDTDTVNHITLEDKQK